MENTFDNIGTTDLKLGVAMLVYKRKFASNI